MIYEIYIDGKILFYPNDEKYAVYNAKLDQQLNDSGTLEFDVPSINPEYDHFNLRSSMVQVLKDGVEVFCGEVREIKQSINFTKHIYCVGELAFLFDTIQPQAVYHNATPTSLFGTFLAYHNSQADERKQFQLGRVTVTDSNDSLYRFTNFEDTLTAIRDKLCKGLDGYLKIRKVDGVKYLDLLRLDDYAEPCGQTISFGRNMLQYSCNMSSQDVATSVIPLGAKLETSEVEGLDAYTDITSVNDNKNYLNNDEAIENIGMVRVVQHWDDVTLPENLKAKALNWLTDAQFSTMTLELSAVDLSVLDADIDSFELGALVRTVSRPFGMDTILPVQKKTININDLGKNTIVLGNVMQLSFTQQSKNITSEIEDKLPQTASLMESARQSALQLLEGTSGGYITYVINEDGQITEQWVTNNVDKDKATKKWVWTLGGLGFMERTYDSSTGQYSAWTLKNAMTMDGKIVAERIGAGEIRGCSLLSDVDGEYVHIKDGDVFGGNNLNGEHGYLTFSAGGSNKKQVTLVGTEGLYLYGNGAAIGIGDDNYSEIFFSSDNLKVNNLEGQSSNFSFTGTIDGVSGRAIGLTFTNGILTNVVHN